MMYSHMRKNPNRNNLRTIPAMGNRMTKGTVHQEIHQVIRAT